MTSRLFKKVCNRLDVAAVDKRVIIWESCQGKAGREGLPWGRQDGRGLFVYLVNVVPL
jgi:hypothetical protein